MNRRDFIKTTGFVVAGLGFLVSVVEAADGAGVTKPNVIFILGDDLAMGDK